MKKLLEIVLCVLHPLAVVLIWIDLLGRSEMALVPRLTWAVAAIVPVVPFVYVLTGHDFIYAHMERAERAAVSSVRRVTRLTNIAAFLG